jgi:SAM-dependent methyltransferase
MDRAYFLKYFEFEKKHWWFRARAEILREYIQKNCLLSPGLKILNVGAATGGSIEWLSELGEVTSLEFDKESVLFIKDHLKANILEGSILSLPFSENAFDLVCAFDVIEHVENDYLAFQELARVCKEKSSVLITVPAHMHLWSQHDVVNQHYRRYSLESLRSLMNSASTGKLEFITFFNSYFYFPIRIVRKANNFHSLFFRSKKLKSDFEKFSSGFYNEFFFSIMRREKLKLSEQRPYSRGVSLLAHWRKESITT